MNVVSLQIITYSHKMNSRDPILKGAVNGINGGNYIIDNLA